MKNPFLWLFRMSRPAASPHVAHRPVVPPTPAVAPEPDPFDPVWSLLTGPAAAQHAALTPEEAEQVEALVPMVLEHFSRNRPDLSTFPALAVQILDLLNEPDLEMNRLLRAISPDPAIVVHVLGAANSVMYSRGAEIQDMRTAVMRIGLRGVGEIAAGVATRTLFDVPQRVEYRAFKDRWNQQFLDTMAVAFGASQFAFEQQVGRADLAFQAGMFHDIGKSLALHSVAAITISGEVASPVPDHVIDEVLERVHVEVGCALILIWGLPAHLSDVCLHHHDKDIPKSLDFMNLHSLRLASGMHRLVLDPTSTERLDETRQSLQALGLSRRAAQRLYHEMEHQVERVAVLFQV